MRILAYSLMFIGFAGCLAVGLSSYHHTAWIWHTQQLKEGENIEREAVESEMRALSLDLNERYRIAILPASLILIGGILNGTPKKESKTKRHRQPSKLARKS
ncbi:hypothetical protein [Puniceicoccus vermicola]|uniref:Uncharacterized protein n=1 Tax=Puniceicoccus vermicola TaxID=388746 RepID=A0A7X1B0U7_9BACT|nr:hypothetical protein [Puniceicoccus vermicola]MBC2603551.1 hypothetical protein [Puniceicoccus vermicola]